MLLQVLWGLGFRPWGGRVGPFQCSLSLCPLLHREHFYLEAVSSVGWLESQCLKHGKMQTTAK